MSAEMQEALQLAILEHPAVFGLPPAEVNPLVLYIQHRMDFTVQPEEDAALRQDCFAQAKAVLEAKLLAVLGSFSHIQDELASQAITAEVEAPPAPEPLSKPSRPPGRKPPYQNGKAAGNGKARRNSSTSREAGVTPRQIKYYGYLCHQAGEVPDYTAFAQLTLNQASARIKAMGGK
jgi:hypothetical protein